MKRSMWMVAIALLVMLSEAVVAGLYARREAVRDEATTKEIAALREQIDRQRLLGYAPFPAQNGPVSSAWGQPIGGGVSVFNGTDRGEEPVFQSFLVDAGTNPIVWMEAPQFAPGEVCDFDALIDFTPPGTSTTIGSATGKLKREILGVWNGTACVTPDGGTFDHSTYSDLGPAISDASAVIVQLDGSVGVQAFSPVSEATGVSLSGVRRLTQWQGADAATYFANANTPALVQVYPTIQACSDAGQTLNAWVTYPNAAYACGLQVGQYVFDGGNPVGANGSAASVHIVQANVPSLGGGSCYDASVPLNVSLLTSVSGTCSVATNVLPCPNCLQFNFSATPTVTGISIAYTVSTPGTSSSSLYAFATDAAGNSLVATVTGTNLTGATSVTLNGIACTGISGGGSSLTCTPGATTSTAAIGTGNVVVTTSSGTGTGSNLVTYLDTPMTCAATNLGATSAILGWYEARSCTQSSGSVSAIPDLSGNSNNATTVTAITYTASDANYSSTPSWSCNGTTSTVQTGAVTVTNTASNSWLGGWEAQRFTDVGNTTIMAVSATPLFELRHPSSTPNAIFNAITGTYGSAEGSVAGTYAGYAQAAATTPTTVIFRNASPVTGTGGTTGSIPSGNPLSICSRNSVSIPSTMTLASAVLFNPNSSQTNTTVSNFLTCMSTYSNRRFGFN